jgi:predicted nucleic acid-binding Zn ribbon protein
MVQGINSGRYWYHNRNYPIQDPKAQFYRRGFLCESDSHKTYVCIDCGKIISKGAERCVDCEKERRRKRPLEITREELKTLIRTKSFLEIGRMYGVSDNAIRKWCKKYDLPSRVKDIKTYSDKEWVDI